MGVNVNRHFSLALPPDNRPNSWIEKLRRIVMQHDPDVFERETLLDQQLASQPERFDHRWIMKLPDIGGDDAVSNPDFSDRIRKLGYRCAIPARQQFASGEIHDDAALDNSELLFGRQFQKKRMIADDPLGPLAFG